jgi:hypothetical protein
MDGIIRIKEENPDTQLLFLDYDNTFEEIDEDAFIRF